LFSVFVIVFKKRQKKIIKYTGISMEVWRLQVCENNHNHFITNRSESWNLVFEKDFPTLEEAKKYVIAKSLIHTVLPWFLLDHEHDKEKFIEDFCFNNPLFLTKRRFFLGKPSRKSIIDAVEAQGIKVVERDEKQK
jgi:hypothetical protein